MTSLKELLSNRDTRLVGETGDPSIALKRLPLSRILGDEYQQFDSLRRYLENKLHKNTDETFRIHTSKKI